MENRSYIPWERTVRGSIGVENLIWDEKMVRKWVGGGASWLRGGKRREGESKGGR